MERWFVALCGICSRWLFSVASNSLSRLMVPSPSLSFPLLPSSPHLSPPPLPSSPPPPPSLLPSSSLFSILSLLLLFFPYRDGCLNMKPRHNSLPSLWHRLFMFVFMWVSFFIDWILWEFWLCQQLFWPPGEKMKQGWIQIEDES